MITVINKSIDDENETITVSVPKTYVVKYDKECVCWSSCDQYNRSVIDNLIQYFNSKLDIGTHVIMNDVLEALCMARISEGYLVGWRPGSRVCIQVEERDENGGYLLKIITDGIIIDDI